MSTESTNTPHPLPIPDAPLNAREEALVARMQNDAKAKRDRATISRTMAAVMGVAQ